MYSENELISEIRKRNKKAYDILIQEYTKPIYYLAHNILNVGYGKEDIEECVSDVLLEAWLKIEEFDSERGSFKTWLLILTKYKALAYKRKNSKISYELIDNLEEHEQLREPQGVEQTVIGKETQALLLNTINSFSKTDKELFIRRYFYDEPICALMESLHLSRSAIDNRLSRGRRIIKEVLSNE